jgi:Protein of unknown function (DUF2778)
LRDFLAWYALVSKVFRAQPLRRLLGPLLITSFGTALAGVTVWSVAGMVVMGSSLASGSSRFLPSPQFYLVERIQAQPSEEHASNDRSPRLLTSAARRVMAVSHVSGRQKSAGNPDVAGAPDASGNAARFDAVVKQAGLTSEKLARLFDRSSSAKSHRPTAKHSAPTPERFASPPPNLANQPATLLAYADPSPSGPADAALSGLLAAPLEGGLAESQDQNVDGDDAAALPDYEDTPTDGPLPQLRQRGDKARDPAEETEQPDAQQAAEPAPPKAEPKRTRESETPKPQKLAYARPDNPTERKSGGGLGQSLRNLFGGGSRAGNGVAVYDISAAKVYMPDGSVLEAHSGIGKMADDPRYVHVRMNGPTPPHTYNLRMREKRFHGVEAIRMLPVDGRNKYGRDGFLTHSYLLRGGRAESHGCVAFKDYKRFLTAFKQGKVRQLVVVPSGGRASMLASNGNRI